MNDLQQESRKIVFNLKAKQFGLINFKLKTFLIIKVFFIKSNLIPKIDAKIYLKLKFNKKKLLKQNLLKLQNSHTNSSMHT